MNVNFTDNKIIITGATDFSPDAIFTCGQCFRWDADDTGAYTGVAHGRVLRVCNENGDVTIESKSEDFDLWRDYFDLDTDYAAIRAHVSRGDYMSRAADFGAGIRILRQDAWEALCSFIISQCNNIPRIKQIVTRLCEMYGEEIDSGHYAFPLPERLAILNENDLAPLRAGYRAKYIINAAQAVASGAVDLRALSGASADEAIRVLRTIPGVGLKVATCAALFGLRKTDVFPVDTWMKKAIKGRFTPDFDWNAFSPYAGVAQQYIFHYERGLAKGAAV